MRLLNQAYAVVVDAGRSEPAAWLDEALEPAPEPEWGEGAQAEAEQSAMMSMMGGPAQPA